MSDRTEALRTLVAAATNISKAGKKRTAQHWMALQFALRRWAEHGDHIDTPVAAGHDPLSHESRPDAPFLKFRPDGQRCEGRTQKSLSAGLHGQVAEKDVPGDGAFDQGNE